MKLLARTAIGISMAGLLLCEAQAQVWNGSTSQDWFNANNWTPIGVPTASSSATIDSAPVSTPVTVASSGAVAGGGDLGSVGGNTGWLSVTGTGALSVVNGQWLTVGDFGTGGVTVSGGGTLASALTVLGNNAGSTGSGTVTGADSLWSAGALYISADNSVANLTVSAGGRLTANSIADIADYAAGGSGTLTVTDGNSSFIAGGPIFSVGNMGTGTFNVLNGATASTPATSLGGTYTGGIGFSTVSGLGSKWTITSPFTSNALNIVGSTSGSGLSVLNGGQVVITPTSSAANSGDVLIGNSNSTSNFLATLLVDGAGSTFTDPYRLIVGYANHTQGSVTVSNGGQLNTGFTVLGNGFATTPRGQVLVTGTNSTWTIADTAGAVQSDSQGLIIGQAGAGILTIADSGTVRIMDATANVNIGGLPGSSGTLNIGAAAGATPVAPGTLIAGKVIFATTTPGPLSINFNHTSDNYVFAPQITGSGPGAVNILSGTTIFTADDTYTGTTTISPGATLQLGNGGPTGSITTGVTDNGTLVFNRSGSIYPLCRGNLRHRCVYRERGTITDPDRRFQRICRDRQYLQWHLEPWLAQPRCQVWRGCRISRWDGCQHRCRFR